MPDQKNIFWELSPYKFLRMNRPHIIFCSKPRELYRKIPDWTRAKNFNRTFLKK